MEATLSVLFTDAVASTATLDRLGDERFRVVQEAHLGLLRAAAAGRGGREVKSLGDGLMMVFTGAADALGCAVAMQQAVEAAQRRGDDGLTLRVGVAAGDVTVADDGDVLGSVVVEAARLCAVAAGGQILASDIARGLAGSRGGHAYTALGLIELAGFAEPVAAVEVGWAPVADGDVLAPLPLPARLARESTWTFVGRSDELKRVAGFWRMVLDGSRRVVLLAGEPGAGKTRLAREVAVRAHREGALALFGRIDEDLAVAYQPFAEALAHYLAAVDDDTRERTLRLRGGVLGRLVPEMIDAQPEGQIEAWAVFEGLVDWLAAEAQRRPVVLVLDDLHWAARPTLGALMHLARSDRLGRVLVLGTYRDTELGRTHPLAAVLADLRREDCVERLGVRGLDPDEVAAFVEAARGGALDDDARELAARISRQTEGNPFFVTQILRNLSESGAVERVDGRWVAARDPDALEVPEGVREVVGRRVSRLSSPTGELLQVAAVAGPEFDTSIVAAVAEKPPDAALNAFDEAVASRLLLETNLPGRLRFAHALVRQTLIDELTTLRRVHLHRDLALAIERRYGDADHVVAELAHHFAEAAVAGEAERAAHYAERAAGQAADRGAIDQAVDLFEQALELLPAAADPDGLHRDRLYHHLCHCGWMSTDLPLVEDASRRWLTLAQVLGDDTLRIGATAWLANASMWRQAPEPGDLANLAEVLALDPARLTLDGRRAITVKRHWAEIDAPALRSWLLAAVAVGWAMGAPLEAIADSLPGDDPLALADEACRVAECSAYPEWGEQARFLRGWSLVGAPDARALLETGEEAIRLGYTFVGGGWALKALALARLGRLDELRAWTGEMMVAADRSGDRGLATAAHLTRAYDALVRGRIDDARLATDRMLPLLSGEAPYRVSHAVVTIGTLLATGNTDEARTIADALDANPAVDFTQAVGVVAVAQGDLETARNGLDAWHAAGDRLPADSRLPGRIWALAECAHAVGDRDAAALLYDQLLPYDGQLLVISLSFIPASAAFTLGLLAEVLGKPDRAIRHYTDALALEQQCGAEPLSARTRAALASLQ